MLTRILKLKLSIEAVVFIVMTKSGQRRRQRVKKHKYVNVVKEKSRQRKPIQWQAGFPSPMCVDAVGRVTDARESGLRLDVTEHYCYKSTSVKRMCHLALWTLRLELQTRQLP